VEEIEIESESPNVRIVKVVTDRSIGFGGKRRKAWNTPFNKKG